MKIDVQRSGATMTLEFKFHEQIPMQDLLCDLERTIIGTFLTYHNGNKSHTAESLKLNRTTLVEKAKKYGFPINRKL